MRWSRVCKLASATGLSHPAVLNNPMISAKSVLSIRLHNRTNPILQPSPHRRKEALRGRSAGVSPIRVCCASSAATEQAITGGTGSRAMALPPELALLAAMQAAGPTRRPPVPRPLVLLLGGRLPSLQ